MKRKLILVLVLLTNVNLYSQIKISPEKEVTYTSPKHTNRDFLNVTLKDSDNNIYLVGSTENDFTFSDIKVIKLDSNLNQLWEREKSFDVGISYDGIMGAHLNSNDELLVICRAAYTSYNQTFVVLKYNKEGNLEWEHFLSDKNDPTDFSFYSYYSYIDQNDNLHIKYKHNIHTELEHYFVTISSSGNEIDKYSKINQFKTESSTQNRYKITHNDDTYYSISVEDLNDAPYQKFTLHKFNKDKDENHNLNLDSNLISYFNTPFAETWTNVFKDKNDGLVLIAPRYGLENDFGILYLNLDGTIKYYKLSDENKDRFVLGVHFDEDNNLIIVSNNKPKSDNNSELQLTIQKYNENGDIIFEKSNDNPGELVTFEGNNILVYNDNKIHKFDADFNLLETTNINSINSYAYRLNSLFSIGENFFLSGMSENKMFDQSSYLSQKDFFIKKSNKENEISTFTFSGKGTSNISQLEEVVVRDTAYAFSFFERLGPSDYSPGGNIAPKQKHFLTFDKNLNLLEDKVVGLQDILYTTYYDKKLEKEYNSNGNNYKYKINNDTTKVELYKNNSLSWSRNINLEYPEQILDLEVSNKGDFYFTTQKYYSTGKLFKFTLDNNHELKEFQKYLAKIISMTNNWLFTTDKNGDIKIFSERLTIINEGNIEANNPIASYIAEKNNYIMFHPYSQDYISVFNQFGEKQDLNFSIDIDKDYAWKEYEDNFLISMHQKGTSISLSQEYAWVVASIKKYNLNVGNHIPPISYDDDDNDGITNNIDECRNTPSDESANDYGCSSSQVLSNDIISIPVISINPNPSTGIINLSIENNYKINTIIVYNYLGQLVYNESNPKEQVNLSNLKKGIYFLQIKLENGTFLKMKKVVLN